MEAQIKEECDEASICNSEDLASLTLIERYDRFLSTHESESDTDSDDDLFSDQTIRQEYMLMKRNTANYLRMGDRRLSTEYARKYKTNLNTNPPIDVEETSRNGSSGIANDVHSSTSCKQDTDMNSFDKLIEQLNEVKKNVTDWKTFSFTEEEFNKVSYIHAKILSFIARSAKFFDKSNIIEKEDSDEQQNEEVEVEKNIDDDEVDIKVNDNGIEHILTEQEKEDKRLLTVKIDTVSSVRDKFYEVEQQVREYIEQLELVERYKMESVG